MRITPASDETSGAIAGIRRWSSLRALTGVACYAYALSILITWLLVWSIADRWWVATVLMFAPAWLFAVPLLLLIPLTIALHRPRRYDLWIVLVVAVLVQLFGLSGLQPRVAFGDDEGPPPAHSPRFLRIVTLNIDYRASDVSALQKLIHEVQPHVFAAQAWSDKYAAVFPRSEWKVRREDETFIASRFTITHFGEIDNPLFQHDSHGTAVRYRIAAPMGEIELLNVHFATQRPGLTAVIQRAWGGADAMQQRSELRQAQSLVTAEAARATTLPLVVLGDFNMRATGPTWRRDWNELTDAFGTAGTGFGFTHFTRRTQLRIDHILVSEGWRVDRCCVGPNVGSAHRPVVADLEWLGSNTIPLSNQVR